MSDQHNSSISKTEAFKENVSSYIKLDDKIKELKKELNELNKQKSAHESLIIDYLEESGENIINIKGSKLRKNKSEMKGSCNFDIIKEAIDEECNDELVTNKILQNIDAKRQKSVRTYLKRTVTKDN